MSPCRCRTCRSWRARLANVAANVGVQITSGSRRAASRFSMLQRVAVVGFGRCRPSARRRGFGRRACAVALAPVAVALCRSAVPSICRRVAAGRLVGFGWIRARTSRRLSRPMIRRRGRRRDSGGRGDDLPANGSPLLCPSAWRVGRTCRERVACPPVGRSGRRCRRVCRWRGRRQCRENAPWRVRRSGRVFGRQGRLARRVPRPVCRSAGVAASVPRTCAKTTGRTFADRGFQGCDRRCGLPLPRTASGGWGGLSVAPRSASPVL